MQTQTKAAVTVAEMARMVGLSRARFYQLLGTAFPLPVYDVTTRRPHFVEEMQQSCLEVRRRNCGIDGKPILFYSVRSARPLSTRVGRTTKKESHAEIIDGLKSLGVTATAGQVTAALKERFPQGNQGVDAAEVLKAVFVHLKTKCQN